MSTPNEFTGLNIPPSPSEQIRTTIETIDILGDDIRTWPDLARKELLLSNPVTILDAESDAMATAPKLALVVVSPVFREYFRAHPDATMVQVYISDIEAVAVQHIVKWIDAITTKLDGKFGIGVPATDIDLIKVRYAAYKLALHSSISRLLARSGPNF